MFYQLPLTDPRYLDADEETVERDLLLIYAAQQNARHDTGEAQAERLAMQPGIGAHMEARKHSAMSDPAMVTRLQALGVRIGTPPKPAPKPTTISFRRKGGKHPVKP